MVVSRLKGIALWTALLTLLAAVALQAQESPPPRERTRLGITATAAEGVAATNLGRIRASASNILLQSHPDALFVNAPPERFLSDGKPDLAAADAELLDLLIVITLGAPRGEEQQPLTLELYDVRAAELIAAERTTVSIGRLGRYIRSSSWEESVAGLDPYIDAYRPFSEVVILTEAGARVSWPEGNSVVASEEGRAVLRLRNMRSYTLTAEAQGYRTDSTTLFVERQQMEVTLDLLRYPRWMVELTLADASFPRVGGGRFFRDTTLYVYGELTTRAFGFTPFRWEDDPEGDGDGNPKLISSFPVSELALGTDLFLSDRDRLTRFSLGTQLIGRFIHADYYTGFDPILPVALGLRFGVQRELGEHFFLIANLDSRFYWLRRPGFASPYDMIYQLGGMPLLWQPVAFSIGGRYAP